MKKNLIDTNNILNSTKDILDLFFTYDYLFLNIEKSSKINFNLNETIPVVTNKENYSRLSMKKIKLEKTDKRELSLTKKNSIKRKRSKFRSSLIRFKSKKKNSSSFFRKSILPKPNNLKIKKKVIKSQKLRILLQNIKKLKKLEKLKKKKNLNNKSVGVKKSKKKIKGISFRILKISKRKMNNTMDEIYKKEKEENKNSKKFIIKMLKGKEKSRIKFNIPIMFKIKKKMKLFKRRKNKN